ncbi:MAG TPA: hypothetical protein VN081_07075 [Dongiaceae bacterium]|nr:hypothetical protein [Dongiaceae bacterium]
MALKRRSHINDVVYEIVNHSRSKYDVRSHGVQPSSGTWCYYVVVSEKMLPPDQFEKFWLPPANFHERSDGSKDPIYAYNDAGFCGADWHGGVTFYEKSGGIDGATRYVKIGCDFAHYWDEGREYDFAHVEHEAKATVQQLIEMYPFYSRCPYSGSWQPKEQMAEHNGKLYAPSSIEKMLAYEAERRAKAEAP